MAYHGDSLTGLVAAILRLRHYVEFTYGTVMCYLDDVTPVAHIVVYRPVTAYQGFGVLGLRLFLQPQTSTYILHKTKQTPSLSPPPQECSSTLLAASENHHPSEAYPEMNKPLE